MRRFRFPRGRLPIPNGKSSGIAGVSALGREISDEYESLFSVAGHFSRPESLPLTANAKPKAKLAETWRAWLALNGLIGAKER